jgi:hypothetical protein
MAVEQFLKIFNSKMKQLLQLTDKLQLPILDPNFKTR